MDACAWRSSDDHVPRVLVRRGKRPRHGERFRPYGLSAAHRSIAFGTLIGVRLANRKITLRVNDRGPAT
jgi:rare lipoprotein A